MLAILLEERGLLEKQLMEQKLDYFVAYVGENYQKDVVKLTMNLRSAGFAANFSYKAAKLGKQLKQPSEQNAGKCVIIGEEFKENKLVVKDMATGELELVDVDKFFVWPKVLI